MVVAGAGGSASGGEPGHAGGAAGGGGGGSSAPPASNTLCIFDYDLTLSSHQCALTAGKPEYHCRTNTCPTYDWYEQCLAVNARDAVATCVARGAFIGIASHSDVDACWSDKVATIAGEAQLPELTTSPRYASATAPDFEYPALDERAHWNCPSCAYHMAPGAHKAALVASIMTHYGMDPGSAADRARVIFWDDTPSNLDDVGAVMPEVVRVPVPRNGGSGDDGGCGITATAIDAGWAAIQ